MKEKAEKKNKSTLNALMTETQLRNNAWLTDIEINAFLLKMKDYFNLIQIDFNGLNDPLLTTSLRFHRRDNLRKESFVEVLNSGHNHWVTVASGLPFDGQDVCLFDSMPRRNIDPQLGTTTSLLCDLSRLEKGFLIFRVQNIQTQKNQRCGYFALANAMALCNGLNPENLIFSENAIRDHFINIMFHNQPMSMFPYSERRVIRDMKRNHLIFELHDVDY